MATYMILFSFTPKGVENIQESPARVEAAKKTIRDMGGAVRSFYGILGSEFDTIFVIEAPDEEVVGAMVLAIEKLGNVRTRTHRLFSEEEYAKIISSIP